MLKVAHFAILEQHLTFLSGLSKRLNFSQNFDARRRSSLERFSTKCLRRFNVAEWLLRWRRFRCSTAGGHLRDGDLERTKMLSNLCNVNWALGSISLTLFYLRINTWGCDVFLMFYIFWLFGLKWLLDFLQQKPPLNLTLNSLSWLVVACMTV